MAGLIRVSLGRLRYRSRRSMMPHRSPSLAVQLRSMKIPVRLLVRRDINYRWRSEVTQALSFTVTNDNNGLFAVQPSIDSTGQLIFTPAANANGTAVLTVTLTDDATAGGAAITTSAQTLTISVTAVNDAPSFTIAGSPITVNEESGAFTGTGATSITDGDPEVTQALSFTVTNDNNGLFAFNHRLFHWPTHLYACGQCEWHGRFDGNV